MVEPSDSSAKKRTSRPHRRPSALKAGLVAVQKKQYREAIALLQGVAQGARDPDSQVKAQVGLVKAYAGLGRMKEAIALCEQLTAAPNPSVYQWANQMLRQLQGTANPRNLHSACSVRRRSSRKLNGSPSHDASQNETTNGCTNLNTQNCEANGCANFNTQNYKADGLSHFNAQVNTN